MGHYISVMMGNDSIPCYYSAPEDGLVHPGLIVIEEIWGLNEHIKSVCDRFAHKGYVVLSPELIDEGVLQTINADIAKDMKSPDESVRHAAQAKMREATAPIWTKEFADAAVAKLKACVDCLFVDKNVNGHIGVVGFCFGGTYTFQAAIHDHRVQAAVAFYGRAPEPLDLVGTITCPTLAIYGEKDEPIVSKLPDLVETMKKYDRDFTYLVYPNATHAFFNDTNPQRYNAEAAHDAWDKTLAFLEKHLV
jgi:carboxymethylenebutenolidase